MPKRVTEKERKFAVSVSLTPRIAENLDRNVERFQQFLLRKGLDPKEVQKVNRSELIRELVETLATEAGLLMLQAGICARYGVDDSQLEMNLK